MEKIYLGGGKKKKGERPMRIEAEAQNTRKAGRPGGGHKIRAGTTQEKKTHAQKSRGWIMSECLQED